VTASCRIIDAVQPADETFAAQQRMVNQGLWGSTAGDVSGVLRAFVGMQAQEFHYALWSFAQRMTSDITRSDAVQAFADGLILRTHVLRPTWHFAGPEDIRWMLRLTTPRLRRLMAYYTRQEGLDRAELMKSQDVLARAVAGGRHRTRSELKQALESGGVPSGGTRLAFILMHAEYDEVLISGAMRGKQQTYAAFDERVTGGPDFDEDAALAELAQRFVTTRAPVTAKDLAGWASLTLAQARRGLAAIETRCEVHELDGMSLWSPADSALAVIEGARPAVDLIQGYDELVMSYSESRHLLAPKGALPVPDRSVHLHAILVNGRLAGHWRHLPDRDGAVIDVQLLRPFDDDEHGGLQDAVRRYGRYLGVPTTLAEPVLIG